MLHPTITQASMYKTVRNRNLKTQSINKQKNMNRRRIAGCAQVFGLSSRLTLELGRWLERNYTMVLRFQNAFDTAIEALSRQYTVTGFQVYRARRLTLCEASKDLKGLLHMRRLIIIPASQARCRCDLGRKP